MESISSVVIKKIKKRLLYFFTQKKDIKFNPTNTKKVLVLRYDRIGDMIQTTPIFSTLKENFPSIFISVIASKNNAVVIENNPFVDKVTINSKNNLIGDLFSLIKLRRERYDVCIELDHSVVPHAILRLKLINPKKVISIQKYGRYGLQPGQMQLYNFFSREKKIENYSAKCLATLEYFGIKDAKNTFHLFPALDQLKKAKVFFENFKHITKILINLEGHIQNKTIPFFRFIEIVEGIQNKSENNIFFLISTPDRRKKYLNFLSKYKNTNIQLLYQTNSINDVAAIVKECDMVITPDTSIVHVASTYNVPTLSVHENNKDSFNLWKPLSEINKTVFSNTHEGIEDCNFNLVIASALKILTRVKKL